MHILSMCAISDIPGLSIYIRFSTVTATLVSKENAKGDEDGVQTAVCQALFIAFILAIAGTAFIILRPDFVLKSVLAKDAAAMEFAR